MPISLHEALAAGQSAPVRQQAVPAPPGSPGVGAGSLHDALSLEGPNMSPDDFTKPGEAIPKDAGLMDFIKYNVAHLNPRSEENLMGMAGSVGNVGGAAAELTAPVVKSAKEAGGILRTAKPVDDAIAAFNKRQIAARMGPQAPKQMGPVEQALLAKQQSQGLYKALKPGG